MIVKPDGYVLIGADGAGTHPETGQIIGSVSKILTLPNMSAVIGISGMGGFSNLMQWFLPPHVTDFDGLIEVFAELVQVTYNHIVFSDIAAYGMFDSSVVVGGYSEARQKYEAYRVVTYPKTSAVAAGEERVLEPFVLHPVSDKGMWSSTGPSVEVMKRFGVIDGPEGDDDAALITRMICASRMESGKAVDQGVTFNAGCFVQIAMMQRYHSQSWIAHIWPDDVIGKTIDPMLGQPLPDYLMDHYNAQT
jgi:hypothetical protein